MSSKSFMDHVKDFIYSTGSNDDQDTKVEVKEKPKLDLCRGTTKPVRKEPQQAPITDNYTFACDLFAQVDAKSNTAISPSGVQGILALFRLASGVGSNQDLELQKYFPGKREDFAKALVTERQEFLKCDGIKMMDIIAVRDDIKVLDQYYNLIKEVVSVERLVVADGDKEVDRLNDMGKKFTNGLIPTFLEKGSIDASVLMLVINMIYFKKDWKFKFDSTKTKEEYFVAINGSRHKTKLMVVRDSEYTYWEDADNQYLRIPYDGDLFALTIILPRGTYKLPKITSTLLRTCREKFNSNWHKMHIRTLKFPNCIIKVEHDLKNMCRKMGIIAMFDNPNFDEMLNKFASISEFKQNAVVKFDEEGTEAAAITHAKMQESCSSVEPPSRDFIADHPFTYGIEYLATGHWIFMGNVVAL